MRYLQTILLNLIILPICLCQSPEDDFILISNLKAFTHSQFFFSDCKCSRFNSEYLWFDIYIIPTDSTFPYMRADEFKIGILPFDFDVGYEVIITGKKDSFFRIEFNGEDPYCSRCKSHIYYVKKGTLGTWVSNYNDSTGEYDLVPLYRESTTHSKIIAQLKPNNSAVIILEVNGEWMLVETISHRKKKRGWLDPKMQFGSPFGT
jgi:hypothetical protein